MGVLPKGAVQRTENAAPNYVPYEEERTYIPLNVDIPARLAQIVKGAEVSRESQFNNAPYINAQTFWANPAVIQRIQGYKNLKNG